MSGAKSWGRYLIVCNIFSSIFSDHTVFKRHSVFKRLLSPAASNMLVFSILFYRFFPLSRFSPLSSGILHMLLQPFPPPIKINTFYITLYKFCITWSHSFNLSLKLVTFSWLTFGPGQPPCFPILQEWTNLSLNSSIWTHPNQLGSNLIIIA